MTTTAAILRLQCEAARAELAEAKQTEIETQTQAVIAGLIAYVEEATAAGTLFVVTNSREKPTNV